MYGEKVDTKNYLKKFFPISFKLDTGSLSNEFINQHKSLFEQFDFVFSDNVDITVAFDSILPNINMREREQILQKIEMINSSLIKDDELLDFSILYLELFLTYCFHRDVNFFESEVHYEQNTLSIIFEKDSHMVLSSDISKYFENLESCHNVKHEFHGGYEALYTAKFEYVLAHLMNNLIDKRVPEYGISYEQDFYRKSYAFLNTFIELYKSIEL